MDPKELLATYTLNYLRGKKIIGVGTGKTVKKLIEVLSSEENLKESSLFVASSIDTEIELSKRGFKVLSLFSAIQPEIYVDSFDIVTKDGIMIKGGGGALLREKLLAYFSKYRIFIGESTKLKDTKVIDIPIEVISVGVSYVKYKLEKMGFTVKIREGSGKMGPIISDNGNVILDVSVKTENLCEFDRMIKNIPSIVETGIFCKELYNKIILANEQGRIEEMDAGDGI
ncbi:ribose 5-phosphate isomerase A [Saccharolobus solfataricus]|uniref:Ribose 5-phosphate isomerase A n=3 Tax=Saccharolobus solfataricus TaxID=2287 RepID=Q97ZD9_SACS2|nr:ribose 5-phosphate isomerase A [Saccharolobus solfataricus]AAK41253.1 Ribose 5-phosphate isomerase (rpiA) [Saccharolobus solfataricus P2]AYN75608.1 ribose 5-phosphate isomerase A [Saccharolobus solfataricus]AYN75771.1 ribose 5-phosphate isomerase A [Saccharolobus solfataricus]AYP18605.1 ribose 5-phosphate isomerase A [Saccharolobus solfataricus]AZF68685.1 ribose 5-phosphate isomerase A [Saccharolobus solfataricus]